MLKVAGVGWLACAAQNAYNGYSKASLQAVIAGRDLHAVGGVHACCVHAWARGAVPRCRGAAPATPPRPALLPAFRAEPHPAQGDCHGQRHWAGGAGLPVPDEGLRLLLTARRWLMLGSASELLKRLMRWSRRPSYRIC